MRNDNTLTHYGILGMKWGVRRTEAQLRAARGKLKSESSNSESNAKKSSSSGSKKKSVSEMSDTELFNTVQRLNLEKRYKELNPERVSLGKRFVDKVTKDVIIPAATEVAKNAVKDALNDLVKKSKQKK